METSRLIIERVAEEDFENLIKIDTCSAVRKYLGGPLDYNSAYVRAAILVKVSPDLFWVSRDHNRQFTGTISLKKHHDSDEMEISYQLMPDAWGKGFATEALEKVIKHVHENLNIMTILAETQAKNLRSVNLLRKLGFREIRKLERFGEPLYKIKISYPLGIGYISNFMRPIKKRLRFLIMT